MLIIMGFRRVLAKADYGSEVKLIIIIIIILIIINIIIIIIVIVTIGKVWQSSPS